MEARNPPLRPRVRRVIAVPSTLFRDDKEPLKTYKVGFLARVAAIFRVEDIVIFLDEGERRNASFLRSVLEYIDTPQYLRRMILPLKRSLKYVGILPPLRAPHHPGTDERGFLSEYREGIVVGCREGELLVHAGLEKPLVVKGRRKIGTRVTVKILDKGAEIVDRSAVPYYWGFKVRVLDDLREVVRRYGNYLKIATSFYGDPLLDLRDKISRELGERKGVLIAFGSKRGLFEIARSLDVDLRSLFDAVINFIPNQGTYTVRTEEAIPIVLSALNLLLERSPP